MTLCTRLLFPWNVSGQNTGALCQFLLQGIFLTWGLKLHLQCFLVLAGVFFTIEPDIPISLFLLATCFSCLRHDGVDGTWRKEKAISLRYILFNFYFFQLQFWMVLLYLWISQLDGFSKKILHNLIYYITFSKAILDFCNCLLEKLTYCLLSMNSSDVLK